MHTTASPTLPALLFRLTLPAPVWRLWPLPGALALELRDLTARRASFVLLDGQTGEERASHHDPATPWWLALAGADAESLYLDELNPDQLGTSHARQVVRWATGAVAVRGAFAASHVPQLPAVGAPAVHRAGESAHFAALATFIAERADEMPVSRIEYLETGPWLLLAFDRPSGTAALPAQELLFCSSADGRLLLRQPLGAAAPGPEAGLFCTFGPFVYALGALGEIFAWHLPTAPTFA